MLPIYLSMLDGDDEKSKFESLYLTYRKLMFHVANGILNDEGLAEDAVHQAFLKILKNFDKVGEISCHKTRSVTLLLLLGTPPSICITAAKGIPPFRLKRPRFAPPKKNWNEPMIWIASQRPC